MQDVPKTGRWGKAIADYPSWPQNSITSLPTCFRTIVLFIVLWRKKVNPHVQNTFKSLIVLLQKIVNNHFTQRPLNPLLLSVTYMTFKRYVHDI